MVLAQQNAPRPELWPNEEQWASGVWSRPIGGPNPPTGGP